MDEKKKTITNNRTHSLNVSKYMIANVYYLQNLLVKTNANLLKINDSNFPNCSRFLFKKNILSFRRQLIGNCLNSSNIAMLFTFLCHVPKHTSFFIYILNQLFIIWEWSWNHTLSNNVEEKKGIKWYFYTLFIVFGALLLWLHKSLSLQSFDNYLRIFDASILFFYMMNHLLQNY